MPAGWNRLADATGPEHAMDLGEEICKQLVCAFEAIRAASVALCAVPVIRSIGSTLAARPGGRRVVRIVEPQQVDLGRFTQDADRLRAQILFLGEKPARDQLQAVDVPVIG